MERYYLVYTTSCGSPLSSRGSWPKKEMVDLLAINPTEAEVRARQQMREIQEKDKDAKDFLLVKQTVLVSLVSQKR